MTLIIQTDVGATGVSEAVLGAWYDRTILPASSTRQMLVSLTETSTLAAGGDA